MYGPVSLGEPRIAAGKAFVTGKSKTHYYCLIDGQSNGWVPLTAELGFFLKKKRSLPPSKLRLIKQDLNHFARSP